MAGVSSYMRSIVFYKLTFPDCQQKNERKEHSQTLASRQDLNKGLCKMSIELERVLDIPASFWDSRERQYREALARIEEHSRFLPLHTFKECIETYTEYPSDHYLRL